MEPDDNRTQSHAVLTEGTRVGRYRIEKKIGAGGMGEVYLAEDTELDRKVALKFLPPYLCQDDDCRRRFKREAQAAAKLSHPNIIHVYEVSEYQGRPFFAMEHVEGQSLRVFSSDKEFSVEQILELGIQICEGLNAAHEKGVTHRDIKPSNILIDSHGRAKIVDFGLASVVGTEQLTRTGSTLGTIGYMSPEQVQGKEVDRRSDLFSLGVVLYELITKLNPFKRDSEAATLKAVSDDLPEPLARFKSGLPVGLQGIIDKTLEKDVKTRYQAASELRVDLKRLLIALSGVRSKKTVTKQRPYLTLTIGLATVALIVVAVVIFIIVRNDQSNVQLPKYTRLTATGDIREGELSPGGDFYAFVRRTEDRRERFYVADIEGGKPIEVFECDDWDLFYWSPDGSELLIQVTDKEGHWTYLVPRFGGQPRRYRVPNRQTCLSHDASKLISPVVDEGRLYFIDTQSRDTSSVSVAGLEGLDQVFGCSPDGKWMLATSWTPAAGYRLLAVSIDGSISSSIYAGLCFRAVWGPAGDYIYVNIWGPDNPEIIRIPFDPETGESKGESIMVSTDVFQGIFSISNDGTRMLCARGNRSCNLWRVELNLENTRTIPVTTRLTKSTLVNMHPSISPDGNRIAFSTLHDLGADLFIIPAEGGEKRQLTFSDKVSANPEWSPDGSRLIYFSVKETDAKDVSWSIIDLTDGSIARIPFNFDTAKADCEGITTVQWFPSNLVVMSVCGILFIDPVTGECVTVPGVTTDRSISSVHYSPDASALAVHWDREGEDNDGIWIIPLDEKPARFVLQIYPDAEIIGWSPDAGWIYFWVETDEGTFEIRRVMTDTADIQVLAVLSIEPQESITQMDLAPDASWAVFNIWETPLDLWLVENFDPYVK